MQLYAFLLTLSQQSTFSGFGVQVEEEVFLRHSVAFLQSLKKGARMRKILGKKYFPLQICPVYPVLQSGLIRHADLSFFLGLFPSFCLLLFSFIYYKNILKPHKLVIHLVRLV